MPAEEIAAGVVRVALRFVWELLIHVVFDIICYGLGFGFLRAVSLNRYPREPLSERGIHVCQCTGLAILVAVFGGLALYLSLFG